MMRYLLCLLGILIAVPAFALTTLAFATPITVSGIAYLAGAWLIVIGSLFGLWRPRYGVILALSGVALIGLVAGIRLSRARRQTSNTRVIVLPAARETRWVNWLIDEEDSVIFGEEALHLIGGASSHEHDTITAALSSAYDRARPGSGVFPSPVISTYLGLQKPTAFDAIVIEPTAAGPAPIGIIFLHGSMGNVVVQCWQIAQAAETIGAITVCPSTNWIGEWWQPEGEAILRATLHYLRGRGIERFFLGGFSNGGYGLSTLAPKLASEPGLRGLFFIAGVRNGAAIREANLPVLVIQGIDDERVPVTAARQFVDDLGPLATYAELESDHFLIIKQSQRVQTELGAWLESHK